MGRVAKEKGMRILESRQEINLSPNKGPGSLVKRFKLTYIEDITRWREDMNRLFSTGDTTRENNIHIFKLPRIVLL